MLFLNGTIAEESWFDDDVTPALFRDELNAGTGNITVWINSPGGDCVAAAQIYNMLMDYKGDVTVKIDGIAASAASVIAMAGTKVLMSPVSMMMIHNPATIAFGDTAEMQKAINMLAEVKESIMNAYEIKTGMSRTKISHLMDAETWMDAHKAVELGFADDVLQRADASEGEDLEAPEVSMLYSRAAVTNFYQEIHLRRNRAMTIKDMIEKRAKVWETAKNFVDTHENENGVLSAEDNATYSRMEQEIEDLTAAIDRQQRAEAREAEFNKPVNMPLTGRPARQEVEEKTGRASNAYKEDFGAHLRGKRLVHNVLSEGVQADGGYLVPEEFERQIVSGLDEANVVRGLAKVITTSAERKIPVAATHSTAAWTAENGAYTPSDPSFDQKTIDAFKLTDLVKVSIELLQDSMFDLESYIAAEFARAFGIAEEEAFCVGTGTGQPTGIFTANGGEVGVTAAGSTAVTADELISLVYSLKSPYRRNAKFLANDATISAIRKLKDGNGVYLWQPSLQAGEPDKLLGYDLYTSPYVPQMEAGAFSLAFGDFKNYWIADRAGRTVQRLNELYSTNGQVGFVATERVDGKVILPEGIKLLKMKA